MAISAANIKWYETTTGPNRGGTINTGTQVTAATLFDTVTGDEASAGDIEYRGIFIRQEDATSGGWIDPKLWIDVQTPAGDDISIALSDEGKNATIETIADYKTAPVGPSFTAPANKTAGLALPSAPYAQNDYEGIWIKRNVPASTGAYTSNSFTLKCEGDSAA